jgi:hypothetical protein
MPNACTAIANCHGAADRSLRPVEHRKRPVSRGVHLTTPKAGELRPDHGVVRIEQRTPVPFAERGLGTFVTPDDDGNPYAAG